MTDDADPEMLMMMGELPSLPASSTDPSPRPPPPPGTESPSSSSPDQNDESTASSTTAAEQADPKRARSDMENLLLGGGGGWSAFVRDGFLAAGTGRALHASDEDVELFKRRYWRSRGKQPRELEEVVERIWEVECVEAIKEAEWLLWERVCHWARAHVHRLSGRESSSLRERAEMILTVSSAMARSQPHLDLNFVPEFWAALDVISRSVQTATSHLENAIGTDSALADQEAFLRGNFRLVSLGLCYLTFACDRTLALRRAQQEDTKRKREAASEGLHDEAQEAEYAARLAELKASSELRCFEAARSIVAIMHRSLSSAASMGIVTGESRSSSLKE